MPTYLQNIHAAGTAANRPAAGVAGRLYFSTDTAQLHRDSGAAWVLVGVGSAWRLAAAWHETQTRTNLSTAYTDIYTFASAEGMSIPIDFTGATQVRMYVHWNSVGASTQTLRIAEENNETNNNACETATTPGGERIVDSGWVALPAGFVGQELKMKIQAKSGNGTDDPIFRSGYIYIR